ncbi:MAG: ABC transporter permease [Bacilli bacterium]
MSLNIVLSALEIGLIFSILSLGIYITFKILDFPDLSVDGSFSLGAVTSTILVLNNQPFIALLVALLSGMMAGLCTALLHTKLKIQYILAGIITMSALYSINLRIASNRPNIPLLSSKTIYNIFNDFINQTFNLSLDKTTTNILILTSLVIIIIGLLNIFFKTPIGLAIRATGNNEAMVKASSINTDLMKCIALMMANGLVALSAALYVQFQMFYDIAQGIGMMIVGLTGIIIGEALFGSRNLLNSFIAVALGAITYRLIVALSFQLGMQANDLKLLSSILVALTISLPIIKLKLKRGA